MLEDDFYDVYTMLGISRGTIGIYSTLAAEEN